MEEAIVLTDATYESVLNDGKPVLLLFSNGEGLRGDFSTAYKNAAKEHQQIVFAKIDPTQNPTAAARFDVGSRPVLVVWHRGEEVVRRIRPWGSDVALVIDMLQKTLKEEQPEAENAAAPEETAPPAGDAPVAVTDATFQQEVIDYPLPVLVDFWAPWCGPCRQVAPILDKLAKEYAGKIRIAKVNVDENPMLAQTFRVMSIPTIMLLKERNIVFSQPGALPEPALRDLINQLIALKIPPQASKQPVN